MTPLGYSPTRLIEIDRDILGSFRCLKLPRDSCFTYLKYVNLEVSDQESGNRNIN